MKTITVVLSSFVACALIGSGCSKQTTAPTESTKPAGQLLLSPADGQTNVRLDAPVVLTFAESVDRAIVERGFHLINGSAMADSLCPLPSLMGQGSMMDSTASTMMDSSTMHHLDQAHSMHGQFTWNTDTTFCTFKPDSLMTPRTQYIMHMDREMTQMMEQRTGSMGTMSGHRTGMMNGEMMFYFSTLDTTSTGKGHMGHH